MKITAMSSKRLQHVVCIVFIGCDFHYKMISCFTTLMRHYKKLEITVLHPDC